MLKFVSIVGACKGSSTITRINKLGLSWLTSKNITDEMATDSNCIKRLNHDWKAGWNKASNLKRDYTFIASPHDWSVPNYDSTLMEIPTTRNVRYAIVPYHGHSTIVNATAEAVADIVLA